MAERIFRFLFEIKRFSGLLDETGYGKKRVDTDFIKQSMETDSRPSLDFRIK